MQVSRWTGASCGMLLRPGVGREGAVTWLGLGGCGGSSVPRQQVHQQLSLPAPHWVGVEVGVGVGEAATCPWYRPVSVPSPGPGHGTHAVLAFTPPQPFIRDKTNGQAGQGSDYRHQVWLMYLGVNCHTPADLPGSFQSELCIWVYWPNWNWIWLTRLILLRFMSRSIGAFIRSKASWSLRELVLVSMTLC